jgi:hypothetical protein
MSNDEKKELVDSVKQAFPELQSVTDDKIQFNPPDDAPKSDTLQFLGNLPGRISVWVRRNKFSVAVAVYLFCKDAYGHWTFIRDICQFVRPTIEQMPIIASQFGHWLRCHETLNPASTETGKRLIYSPHWHAAHDDQQLVAFINQQLAPEFGVTTTSTTTTTTTTSTTTLEGVRSDARPPRQDLWFIPEGVGIVSTDIIGVSVPLLASAYRGINNSQFVSGENSRRIHTINAQIAQRNMSQNYRRPLG